MGSSERTGGTGTGGGGESSEGQFERLILPWRDALRANARRLTGNAADAEDLVQETLLRAYSRLRLLRSEETIKGWLFTIQQRLFLNQHLRRRVTHGRRTLSLDSDRYEDALLWPPTPERRAAEPDRALERRMQHAATMTALTTLPEAYRTAVVLSDVQRLSYEEIAEHLGVPIGTVRSRISRGRARLLRSLYAWQ